MKTVRRSNPAIMRQPPTSEDKAVALSDFTGGLDLFRDGGQLTPEFTSDLMNVDLLAGGGFARRKAVHNWTTGTAPDGPVRCVSKLEKADGTVFLVASIGDGMYKITPSAPNFSTDLVSPTSTTATGAMWRMVQANYKGYMQNGTSAPKSWDGTTMTTLAQGFNNASPKYGTYNQGKMPIAKHAAVWHGRMWVANLLESSVSKKSRMRWSFPMINGIGETDWHEDDYFEVDPGVDGDEITALVPAGDRLYVFKAHSIYQVQGWDESNFEVFPLSRTLGAPCPEAIAQIGDVVFFWDNATGLVQLSSEGVKAIFRPLDKLLPSKEAQGDLRPRVGVVERRVWVSFTEPARVSVTGISPQRYTYVFDPALGQFGAWTKFNLQFESFFGFHYATENRMVYLGANNDATAPYHLWELEVDEDYDQTGSGVRSIPSWFRTAWLADGSPYTKKRVWCIEMIIDAGESQSFSVAFYKDWDEATRYEDISFTEQDTTVNDPFIVDKSLVAPTAYELKRPLGYAAPGAYLGYAPGPPQYPGTGTTDGGYSTRAYDVEDIYDNPTITYAGGVYSTPSTTTTATVTTYTDPYVPLAYTSEPCHEPPEGFSLVGPVRDSTLLLERRVTMPQARAVQMLFQGALPSKKWAVRAIMFKYRLVR